MRRVVLGVFLVAVWTVFLGCFGPTDPERTESPTTGGGTTGGGTTGGDFSLDLEMVDVPLGSFQRDAIEGNVTVITEGFRMTAATITQGQFEEIMDWNPSSHTQSPSEAPDRPVETITWYAAIAFANKLSLAEGLTPVYSVDGVDFATLTYDEIPEDQDEGDAWNSVTADWTADGYRLPTEMEWMWAAMGADQDAEQGAMDADGVNRTGYDKPFAGFDGTNNIDLYVWYTGTNSVGGEHAGTMPAGEMLPNELGLYDMSGNVWEWVWDWDDDYPDGQTSDYRGPDQPGTQRVRRGGYYGSSADWVTVARRRGAEPHFGSSMWGFRLVRRSAHPGL